MSVLFCFFEGLTQDQNPPLSRESFRVKKHPLARTCSPCYSKIEVKATSSGKFDSAEHKKTKND